jgi:tetratricopeptide (TPR) repeat protein
LENSSPSLSEVEMTAEEKKLYDDALLLYLDPREKDKEQMSMKIRDRYAGTWRLHQDYAHLGYLVAIAYANLGDFSEFFEIFYKSYQKIPHHFLSYKTQGLLHIKLYDLARTPVEKEKERKLVFQSFKKAKSLYPNDSTLYKMEIAFSKDKEEALEMSLKEIIDKDIVIPRADLSFYFDLLLAHGKDELAQEFLVKAKKWYPYSRTLDAASEMIKQRGEDGARSSR